MAKAIKDGFAAIASTGDAIVEEVDEEFAEGRLLTAMHVRRERHPKLRRALIATRLKRGVLSCDACGFDAASIEPAIAPAAFEAQHLAPLASLGESKTKVSDLALLCATCHRLVHRWIAVNGEWPALARIQTLVALPAPPIENG